MWCHRGNGVEPLGGATGGHRSEEDEIGDPVLGGHRRIGVGEQEQPVPVSTHEPVPRPNQLLRVADQEHVLCIRFGARERTRPVVRIVCPGQRRDGDAQLARERCSEARRARRGRGSQDREDTRLPPRLLEAA